MALTGHMPGRDRPDGSVGDHFCHLGQETGAAFARLACLSERVVRRDTGGEAAGQVRNGYAVIAVGTFVEYDRVARVRVS